MKSDRKLTIKTLPPNILNIIIYYNTINFEQKRNSEEIFYFKKSNKNELQ